MFSSRGFLLSRAVKRAGIVKLVADFSVRWLFLSCMDSVLVLIRRLWQMTFQPEADRGSAQWLTCS